MSNATQKARIGAALRAGQSVTPISALKRWGCFRLAARIADLRAEGWQIERTMIERDGAHFASYRIAS